MSGKHTPGPWRYERAINPDGSHTRDGEHWISSAAGCIDIAITAKDYRVEAQEANARLIAAAPELLAALEDLLSSAYVNDYGDWALPSGFGMDRVHAAIAKARGG